jgi:hypothetical protein
MPSNFKNLSIAAQLHDENAPYDLQNLINQFLSHGKSPEFMSIPAAPKVTQAINETVLIQQLWDQRKITEQLNLARLFEVSRYLTLSGCRIAADSSRRIDPKSRTKTHQQGHERRSS